MVSPVRQSHRHRHGASTTQHSQDPQPEVSLLHNFATQRGLAANGDAGFNRWLLNETVALICGSSMDPFGLQKQRGRGADPSPKFARFFDPVDGTPVPDMFGGSATMAAALVLTLLNPDAPNVAETPPISHDLVFSMVRACVDEQTNPIQSCACCCRPRSSTSHPV